MTRTQTTLGLLLAVSGALYACGQAGLSGFDVPTGTERNPSADAGGFGATAPAPSAGADGLVPVDNAVILVHAAKAQSFRLCFEKETDRLPQPDSDVMPEANVVGVEVGAAVRLGPLRGAPGQVILFEEPLIRPFYPQFGGAGSGPSCKNLLENMNLKQLGQTIGTITTDLSKGVHLVVVRGCTSDSLISKHSVAECGSDWTAMNGNLGVTEITLSGAQRPSAGILPAQVVNLSQPLEGSRGARNVLVSFGDLSTPGASTAAVASSPQVFGAAEPFQPQPLAYDSADMAVYESHGFRVSLEAAAGAGGDAGATTLLDESLARIQKLSSPRDVPSTYYAAASNYALLLLGDPNAKLGDGGPDLDDRRNLHFLAVPVIEPKTDGGADSDAGNGNGGGALDGGAAPTTP
ncbi:MAG: hypothetical protein QOI41_1719 [Myxococcales bacterium]|jgi:hypothetical protein|nr:hypothetical protein [Myxococcales bacterium]